MRSINLIILFFITYSIDLHAQTKNKKLDISVAYGLSLPVGAYKKINPEKSIAYFSDFPEPSGFHKDGNSAAKNGSYTSLMFNYQFHRMWGLHLIGGYNRNSVDTEATLTYINKIMSEFNPNFVFSLGSNDYDVWSLSVGPTCNVELGRFAIQIQPTIGIAWLGSPDYTITGEGDPQRPIPYSYVVNEDEIKSPIFGLAGKVNYNLNARFYVGGEIVYNYVNFEYTWTRKAPGFSYLYGSDNVTYRTVQIGVRGGFRF